jgi:hypothetical protein
MRMSKPLFSAAAAVILSSCIPPPPVPPPRFTPNPPYPPQPVDPHAQVPAPAPPPPPTSPGGYPTAERTTNPNEVLSPYEPHHVIDIEGFSSGQLARDPSNQKIFRVP